MVEEKASAREDFWLRAATWTFGLWAILLPITGKMVVDKIDDIAESQQVYVEEFVKYRELMERRLTILEERQSSILRKVEKIDEERHNEWNNR